MSWFLVFLIWKAETNYSDASPVVSMVRIPVASEAECLSAVSSQRFPDGPQVDGWYYGSGAASMCLKMGSTLPTVERLRLIGPPASPTDSGVSAP